MIQIVHPFEDLHDGLGPTSTAHLLHSQATISSRINETYDQRYQHTFEVSKSGDGLIQVQKPTNDDQHHARSKPLPVDLHIERDVMENLVNAYFADIAPMLPVIAEAEFKFLATPNPPAILMYSMCLVAAARPMCQKRSLIPSAIWSTPRPFPESYEPNAEGIFTSSDSVFIVLFV